MDGQFAIFLLVICFTSSVKRPVERSRSWHADLLCLHNYTSTVSHTHCQENDVCQGSAASAAESSQTLSLHVQYVADVVLHTVPAW